MKCLVINPGSTSTKISLFDCENQVWLENFEHSAEELSHFEYVNEQFEMRKDLVLKTLDARGVKISNLSVISARGGTINTAIKTGAYEVNDKMVESLLYHARTEHASNLAAPIGYAIGRPHGIPVYIYDAVTTDEMLPIARITGFKEMKRRAEGHNLNCRATFFEAAKLKGIPKDSFTAVVVHLGGGITVALIQGGRVIDLISDDEGPFSPERAGGLPYYQLLDAAFSGEYDKASLLRKIRTKGGFVSYFGTTDTREVERRVREGDEEAASIYDAFLLNIAKNVAKISATVSGRVDSVILTGGMAKSEMLTSKLAERLAFIAPTAVIPGENEMKALALGALRVMRGEEIARVFGQEGD
jgi:butyrate kinase